MQSAYKDEHQNKRATGNRYEHIAARFLVMSGYRIIESNYRVRDAEIDLIAREDDTLCFIEVKYRRNLDYGYPAEAVDSHKRMKLTEAAKTYIADRHLHNTRLRFDVVEIVGDKIRVLRDAFGV